MLVSIKERIKEIGVRIAMGTRPRDIVLQFLVETATLTALGGAVGMSIGCCFSWLITYMNDWPTRITALSIGSALLCSVAVGVVFGIYPAHYAAKLDPCQALRQE